MALLKLFLVVLFVLILINLLDPIQNTKDDLNISNQTSEAKISTNEIKRATLENKIAVVVVSCSRPEVSKCLDSIIEANGFGTLPLDYYISQGCQNQRVSDVAKNYVNFTHMVFIPSNGMVSGYETMSWHFYKFLTTIFDELKYHKIIVIEDDLLICKG
ncbi:hypothetical protein RF11_02879 [Thelohanellus kitauei]|uniref:Alpha-1,3-mannosyl-glycoprotein 2-beta-N-acetylglucosaminyltransferase n=1 Tax=Thelohanellus kitauei TaxID=669202 RepID=A0A0C2MAW6_THEKT|nr:hypothetical protein RF11_02879 [Thelohanellus kitauei]